MTAATLRDKEPEPSGGVGLTDPRHARHDARVRDTDTPANHPPLKGADHRC